MCSAVQGVEGGWLESDLMSATSVTVELNIPSAVTAGGEAGTGDVALAEAVAGMKEAVRALDVAADGTVAMATHFDELLVAADDSSAPVGVEGEPPAAADASETQNERTSAELDLTAC